MCFKRNKRKRKNPRKQLQYRNQNYLQTDQNHLYNLTPEEIARLPLYQQRKVANYLEEYQFELNTQSIN